MHCPDCIARRHRAARIVAQSHRRSAAGDKPRYPLACAHTRLGRRAATTSLSVLRPQALVVARMVARVFAFALEPTAATRAATTRIATPPPTHHYGGTTAGKTAAPVVATKPHHRANWIGFRPALRRCPPWLDPAPPAPAHRHHRWSSWRNAPPHCWPACAAKWHPNAPVANRCRYRTRRHVRCPARSPKCDTLPRVPAGRPPCLGRRRDR